MKNKMIILLLLLLTGSIQTKAQDYHKLLDTEKVWYTVQIGEFGEIYHENVTPDYNNIFYAGDTAYVAIGQEPGAILMIVREDTLTKKVYKRNFNSYGNPSGPEEIIYDFSLQEGDSVCVSEWYNSWYYVDSIRIYNMYGEDRNILYLRSKYMTGGYYYYPIWIEGIGSLAGVHIPGSEPQLFIWGVGELTCCYHNEELLYQSANGAQWGCEFELVDQVDPVIDTIWFEPDTIASTDTVRFYIKATDNLSGVYDFYIHVTPPEGEDIHVNGLFTKQAEDIYYCDLDSYRWNQLGIWYTTFVLVHDSVGNESYKYFDPVSFYVDELNDIQGNTPKQVYMYPNPVKNTAFIRFNNPENKTFTLKIYNSLGKLITVKTSDKSFFKIFGINRKQGMYIYQLIKEDKIIYTDKFIISNF